MAEWERNDVEEERANLPAGSLIFLPTRVAKKAASNYSRFLSGVTISRVASPVLVVVVVVFQSRAYPLASGSYRRTPRCTTGDNPCPGGCAGASETRAFVRDCMQPARVCRRRYRGGFERAHSRALYRFIRARTSGRECKSAPGSSIHVTTVCESARTSVGGRVFADTGELMRQGDLNG